jgi:broad specificity phosphatase PhoE
VASPAEFMARVEGALARLLPSVSEPAVLVTSGGPIAVPLFRANQLEASRAERGEALARAGGERLALFDDVGAAFSRGLELANGSLTELRREGDSWRVQPGNPVAHLAPDEITQI